MNKRKITILLIGVITFGLLGFQIVSNRFEVSKNLEIFASVYKEVDLNYVNETKPGELMRKGIDAMLGSLDPYTVFYSEAQAEEAFTQRAGEYGGLGIMVNKIDSFLVITDIFEGYSAQKSGLKIGDKIIEVEGKSFINKTNTDLSPVMKGAKGTTVKLTVNRPGVGLLTKEIERVEIKLKNVPFYGKINNEIGYLHLTQFMDDAANEVSNAVRKLKEQGCKKIVFDLRDNPGGKLNESVDIANLFIPRNQ